MQLFSELKSSSVQEKLLKIFNSPEKIQECIDHIMNDRVFYKRDETHEFVKDVIATYVNSYNQKIDIATASPEELEIFAKNDPIHFLISIIVHEHEKQDTDSTALRDIAFENFQACFNDKNFGRHFFYSRSLLPVLTYLFISSGFWKPAGKDTVEETINEQVMGVYKGTVSYSKDQIIPEHIAKELSKTNSIPVTESGSVKEWFATQSLDDGIENRLNRFYIPSRRKIQKEIVSQYEEALVKTSETIAPIFKGMDRNVLIVIGPYGCGKSTFLKQTYGLEETKSNLVSLSIDTLKGFFASATTSQSSNADFHFECSILKDTVKTDQLNYMFATGAYIDRYRFNGTTRAYSGKNVQLIEIATPAIQDAVMQYCNREHTNRYQFALPVASDAQKFRPERIKSLETDTRMKNIDYKLVCNVPGKGFVDVLEITTKDGQRVIKTYDEELLQSLTNSYTVSGQDIEKLLEEQKLSSSMKV